MDNRERILAAAGRVYSQHGFRGATTRLIAQEAGVNEVTIFRLFGSKADLFAELRRVEFEATELPPLPDHPGDPQGEVAAWCRHTLGHMRARRSLLRKMISEVEENPEAAIAACAGAHCAADILGRYAAALRERGLADADADVRTAISMLMSAMYGDAMLRELTPHHFPEPMESAPDAYVGVFLRALGVTPVRTG